MGRAVGLDKRTFRSANTREVAYHHLPGDGPALFLAGGFSSLSVMEKPLGLRLLDYAQAHGLDLLVMDLPDQSRGGLDWARVTLPDFANYILELGAQVPIAGRIGIGASLGGWALLAAQQAQTSLFRSALLLAPAVDWDQIYFMRRLQQKKLKPYIHDGEKFWVCEEDRILIFETFVHSAGAARIAPERLGFRGPVRIHQGARDDIVPAAATAALIERLQAHCTIGQRLFPQGDHEVTTLSHAEAEDGFIADLDALVAEARQEA